MRWRRLAALVGFVVVAFAAAPATGRQASAFKLKDINGKTFDLGPKLGDKVVLMSFFATWCAPCQAELPVLQQLHEELGDDGLQVVVVSIDDPKSAAKVKPMMRQRGYTFPVLLDTQTKVVSVYNPKKVVPFTVIIDRSGEIVSEKFGFQPGDEEKLQPELKKLLGS